MRKQGHSGQGKDRYGSTEVDSVAVGHDKVMVRQPNPSKRNSCRSDQFIPILNAGSSPLDDAFNALIIDAKPLLCLLDRVQ